jgi:hypothetical protein
MFWLLLASPFILLGLAAFIARKPTVTRTALVLALAFLIIDGFAFWEMFSEPRTSTGSIGLGVLNLIQVAVSLAVLVLGLLARRSQQTDRT